MMRSRDVVIQASTGGTACPALHEERGCNTQECLVEPGIDTTSAMPNPLNSIVSDSGMWYRTEQEHHEGIKAALANATKAMEEVGGLRKKVATLEDSLVRRKKQSTEDKLLLVALSAENAKAVAALPALHQKVRVLMREAAEQTEVLATVSDNNEKLSNQLRLHGAMPSGELAELKERVATLEEETKMLADEKMSLEERLATSQSHASGVQAEIGEERRKVEECSGKLETVESQLSEADTLAASREKELESSNTQLTEKVMELEEVQAQSDKTSSDLERMGVLHVEGQNGMQACEEHKLSLEEALRNKQNNYTELMGVYDAQTAQLNNCSDIRHALKGELDRFSAAPNETISMLNSCVSERDGLADQVQAAGDREVAHLAQIDNKTEHFQNCTRDYEILALEYENYKNGESAQDEDDEMAPTTDSASSESAQGAGGGRKKRLLKEALGHVHRREARILKESRSGPYPSGDLEDLA